MTTASNWLLNWAIAYSTPYLVNAGPGNADLQAKIFFVWGGCCLLCAVFVYGLIYETKGLSLEEVDEMYEKIGSARKSSAYIPAAKAVQSDNGSSDLVREDAEKENHSSM